jgi:hypothetical protein
MWGIRAHNTCGNDFNSKTSPGCSGFYVGKGRGVQVGLGGDVVVMGKTGKVQIPFSAEDQQ